jgi:DNA-binding protein H-NS
MGYISSTIADWMIEELDKALLNRAHSEDHAPRVKYQDPAAPHNTWAGRGRKPGWLVAKLKAGAKLEDFRVKPQ